MVVWRSTFPPGLVCMAIAVDVVVGGWRCGREMWEVGWA